MKIKKKIIFVLIFLIKVQLISVSANTPEIFFKITGQTTNDNFPFIPGKIVKNSEGTKFVIDKSTGIIYKFNKFNELLKKFSYAPDIYKNSSFSFSQIKTLYNKIYYYLDISVTNNKLYILYSDGYETILRILDDNGNLINKIIFKKNQQNIIDFCVSDDGNDNLVLLCASNNAAVLKLYGLYSISLLNEFKLNDLPIDNLYINKIDSKKIYIISDDKEYVYSYYGSLRKINPAVKKNLLEEFHLKFESIIIPISNIYYDKGYIYIYSNECNLISIYKNLIYLGTYNPKTAIKYYPDSINSINKETPHYLCYSNKKYSYSKDEIVVRDLINNNVLEKIKLYTKFNNTKEFIGVTKNQFYFYEVIDLSLYSNQKLLLPVIKVFDKSGSLVNIIKNDIWTYNFQTYNKSKKRIDSEGNIYFITDYSIEKFDSNGDYTKNVISENSNIEPYDIYFSKKFIFVFDSRLNQLIFLNNNTKENIFNNQLTVTDYSDNITDFVLIEDEMFLLSQKKNTTFKLFKLNINSYDEKEILSERGIAKDIEVSNSGEFLVYLYKYKNKYKILKSDINGINPYIIYDSRNKVSNLQLDNNSLYFIENNIIKKLDIIKLKVTNYFRSDNIDIKGIFLLHSPGKTNIFINAVQKQILPAETTDNDISSAENKITDTLKDSPGDLDNKNDSVIIVKPEIFSNLKLLEPQTVKFVLPQKESSLKSLIQEEIDTVIQKKIPSNLDDNIRSKNCILRLTNTAEDTMVSYDTVYISFDTITEITNLDYDNLLVLINKKQIKKININSKKIIDNKYYNFILPLKNMIYYENGIFCTRFLNNVNQLIYITKTDLHSFTNFIRGKVDIPLSDKSKILVFPNNCSNISYTNHFGEFTLLNVPPGKQELYFISRKSTLPERYIITMKKDRPLSLKAIDLKTNNMELFFRAKNYFNIEENILALSSLKKLNFFSNTINKQLIDDLKLRILIRQREYPAALKIIKNIDLKKYYSFDLFDSILKSIIQNSDYQSAKGQEILKFLFFNVNSNKSSDFLKEFFITLKFKNINTDIYYSRLLQLFFASDNPVNKNLIKDKIISEIIKFN